MAEPVTVTDSDGRKIALHLLDPADMLDLMEAAGTASSNSGWVRYASVICTVTAIDDVPIPRPATKEQIKALAKRLGNEGFAAVANYLFGDDKTPAADAEVEAVAKN